jgi:hypothetical protein
VAEPSKDLQDALDAMPDSSPGATVHCPLKDGDKPTEAPKNPCSGWGMSDDKKEKDFADGFKKLQKDWKKLTPDERQAKIKALANGAISPGVPEVGTRPVKMDDAGQLDFSNWRLDLNKTDTDKNEFSDAEAKEFADTVYHETRHAEQWYLMAQKRAAEGKTADEIHKELDIPQSVAESAFKDPLKKPDPRQACADALYDSVYGSKRKARNKTLTDLDTTGDANNKAHENYDKIAADKNATDKQKDDAFKAWQKAYADRQKTKADYMNLPEEADAWDTAGKMKKQW